MAEPTLYDDGDDPHRPIRIGDSSASDATPWGSLLTVFMRAMALLWLLQGLMQWRIVLTASRPIFDDVPSGAAIAIVFFAVLDLVAGVGLWLATPWGGVLWLLIAAAQIFVTMSLPGFFAGGRWLIALDLVLILLYFVLTFEAGRDLEAARIYDRRRRKKPARTTRDPPENTLARTRERARGLLQRLRKR